MPTHRLRSENRRFLEHRDGTPFLYLGDTAWELFHRLTREDAERYLELRRAQGFTVIQAVVLAEFDGLTAPNANGDRPLKDNDPGQPNEAYFAHVDWIVKKAAEKGERYRDQANIIWILGGDRKGAGFEAVWNAMAAGISEGDGGRHLKTYHPGGGSSSSAWFHTADWLDFNMLQSGHAARDFANDQMIETDYARTPIKPVIDGEPRYEDHPINWKPEAGYFDDADVRQAVYWSVFSRPFQDRVPDQSLIAGDHDPGPAHARATRGRTYAFVYLPTGEPVTVRLGKTSGEDVMAWWFNPRTGVVKAIGTFTNHSTRRFDPPGSPGRGEDWVLVLDDTGYEYKPPAHRAPPVPSR